MTVVLEWTLSINFITIFICYIFSAPISTSDSMTTSKKEKIECLNSAAEVLVQSYNEVEKEGEKHKDKEVCIELKEKVDKAYESCANQQQVT